MSMPLPKLAFAFAAFVAAMPVTASFAAPPNSPNAVNNTMVDQSTIQQPSMGIYDDADQFRDLKGFPQSGWQYLSLPPN
jgi:hypothetical protein